MPKRTIFTTIFAFGLWLCCQNAFGQTTSCPNGILNATTSFGMRPNVKSQDSAPLLTKAINYVQQNPSCTEITVKRGKYYFYTHTTSINSPKKISYILLQNMSGLNLDLKGSELVFDNPYYVGVYAFGCSSCVIQNFEMDYQNLPFTQLVVTGVPNGQTIPVTPESKGSGYYLTPNALYEYYANNNLTSEVAFYGFDFRPSAAGGRPLPQYAWGRWDINPPTTATSTLTVAPKEDITSIKQGDIFVLAARGGGPGIWVQSSPGTKLRNLGIYTSGGPGIISESSNNLSFFNVHVVPRPGTNRLVNTAAGGLQLNDVGSSNEVRFSEIVGAQDDSIAGNSSALGLVVGIQDNSVTFQKNLPSSLPAQVFFVDGTTALPVGGGPIGEGQIFTITGQQGNEVTLSPAPSVEELVGALMFAANPAGRGDGLVVDHNTVKYSAFARGIGLSGISGVTITNNTVRYTQQAGIAINNNLATTIKNNNLVGGFGPSVGVNIAGNDLQNVNQGMAGIGGLMLGAIQTLTINNVGNGEVVSTSPNQQIWIWGNRIADTPRTGIWMDNVALGAMLGNILKCTNIDPTTGEDPHLPSGLSQQQAEQLFAHPFAILNDQYVTQQQNSSSSCSVHDADRAFSALR